MEEVGTSNIFFRLGDELVTPPLEGTILAGVTRDSVLQLAEKWGIRSTERRISIHEVVDGCKSGQLKEIFATGTAAVISPVGEFSFRSETIRVQDGEPGDWSQRFYDEITAVQDGKREDELGWMMPVG